MEGRAGNDHQGRSHGALALIAIAVVAGSIVVILEQFYVGYRLDEALDEEVAVTNGRTVSNDTEDEPLDEGTERPVQPPVEDTQATGQALGSYGSLIDAVDGNDAPPHPDQVVRIFADSVTASSTLSASGDITYDSVNLSDESQETAWIADQSIEHNEVGAVCEQAGEGSVLELGSATHPREWLQLNFYREVTLTHLEIINGYVKRDDLFSGNSRIRAVQIVTDSGRLDETTIADTSDVQVISLGDGEGLTTQSLVVEITSLYCGTGVYRSEGGLIESAGHPALTSLIPYGPLSGAVPQDVRDRGILIADMVPKDEDALGDRLIGAVPYPTQDWVSLRAEVVEPVSADWRFAWRESQLFLEANVYDNKVQQPYLGEPARLYRGDSINFEVGPDARCTAQDSKLRQLDRHYLIAPTETSGNLTNAVNVPSGELTYFDAGLPTDVVGTAEMTELGYVVRASVGLPPGLVSGSSGHVLAANFNVSDVYKIGDDGDVSGEGDEWVFGGMASTNPARIEAVNSGETNTRPHLWGTLVLRPGGWTNDLLYRLQAPCDSR